MGLDLSLIDRMLSDMTDIECLKAAIERVNLMTPLVHELWEEKLRAARDVMFAGSQHTADAYLEIEKKFMKVWQDREEQVRQAIDVLYRLMPNVPRVTQ